VSYNGLVAFTHEEYWSEVWSSVEDEIRLLDPRKTEYLDQEYHRFFLEALAGRSGRLLEVGCGSSKWLPYLASKFGYRVSSIDYSQIARSRATERFDVVIYLGLVEHFADTSKITRSLARYVRPGGLLISASPNLSGILGSIQRLLNRPVYDVHVPFTLQQLADAYRQVGLVVQRAAYLGGLDFHVLKLLGTPGRAKWLASRILMRLSRLGWMAPFSVPRSRRWSSAMAVIAARPA
jgi:SAM-dependent methyltransferase